MPRSTRSMVLCCVLAFAAGWACAHGNDGEPVTARGECVGPTELRSGRATVDCYPYRCRAGQCLRRCASLAEDCAPHARDDEQLAAGMGWPLDCQLGACVPVPPE